MFLFPTFFPPLVSAEDWSAIKARVRAQEEAKRVSFVKRFDAITPTGDIVDVKTAAPPPAEGWWTTRDGAKGPWRSREEAAQRGEPWGPLKSRAAARGARG